MVSDYAPFPVPPVLDWGVGLVIHIFFLRFLDAPETLSLPFVGCSVQWQLQIFAAIMPAYSL
jgi:hypothetical protein